MHFHPKVIIRSSSYRDTRHALVVITSVRRTARRIDIIARATTVVDDWRFAAVAFVSARMA
jgi:hypothetical protein